MSKPSISLCMIVRDEEELLPRCLDSVRTLTDDIIIVDTGSADGTIEIAERYGARVIRHVWQNDFAEARNVGLEAATGDWIIFLDADEVLDPYRCELITSYMSHTEIEGILFQIHSYLDEQVPWQTMITPALRMFRNRPEYRFRNAIHEQIIDSIASHKPDAALGQSDLIIHHFGSDPKRMASKQKIKRNRTALSGVLKKEPTNSYQIYNLAVNYCQTHELEQAVLLFRQCRQYDRQDSPCRSASYLHETICLFRLHRTHEAIAAANEGIGEYDNYTDLYHWLGILHLQTGDTKRAEDMFIHALKLGDAVNYVSHKGTGTFRTRWLLGSLKHHTGAYDLAIQQYTLALDWEPLFSPALRDLARLLRCCNREEELSQLLLRHMNLHGTQMMSPLLAILTEVDSYQTILSLLDRRGPGEESYGEAVIHFRALLLSGKLTEAEQYVTANSILSQNMQHQLEMEQWILWMKKGVPIEILKYPFTGENMENENAAAAWLSFAAKAALVNGHAHTARSITGRWQTAVHREPRAIQNKQACTGLIQTLLYMTDVCLKEAGTLLIEQETQQLLREIRISMCTEDMLEQIQSI
ncbi:glycosyltransferase [Paenibacillus tritici]|uniref:Glycosyltransferase n=1 Tax=Paenibacillus tritici TaxID=1873425 RepID=A0ABX2DX54_9BACL|nr:glycosyltransferase family 2 protein [Paenibacillus tritici]NQX48406.1 glycosyltransferase [Paenibacillus tritici]QUL55665.1 glycosyltransferase [Paenibacillus tritici]